MRRRFAILVAAALAASPVVFAQQSGHDSHHAPSAGAQEEILTQGEVKRIDKDAGKITLKHGPIVNLDMPGMTMVFKAKDPAILDSVQVGDTVKFHAENIGGSLTVTELRKAQ